MQERLNAHLVVNLHLLKYDLQNQFKLYCLGLWTNSNSILAYLHDQIEKRIQNICVNVSENVLEEYNFEIVSYIGEILKDIFFHLYLLILK